MAEKNSLPLFVEDVFDALKAGVQFMGGAKLVAAQLWPNKPVEQARKDLLDCLNRDNDRKLDAEDILALLRMYRISGYHGAKHYIDEDTGYEPTAPKDPAVQRDRLADALERATSTFEELTRQAKQIVDRSPVPLKNVK
jgi:hypothetical protein